MATKAKFNWQSHDIWVLWHQAGNLTSRTEEAALAPYGVTPQQFVVLIKLKFADGPVTITELANETCRNANTISMLIDRMVKAGLVRRSRNLPDRRALRITITRKGEEKLDSAIRPSMEFTERQLSCFTDAELRTLVRLLEKLKKKSFEELDQEDTTVKPGARSAKAVESFWAKSGSKK